VCSLSVVLLEFRDFEVVIWSFLTLQMVLELESCVCVCVCVCSVQTFRMSQETEKYTRQLALCFLYQLTKNWEIERMREEKRVCGIFVVYLHHLVRFLCMKKESHERRYKVQHTKLKKDLDEIEE